MSSKILRPAFSRRSIIAAAAGLAAGAGGGNFFALAQNSDQNSDQNSAQDNAPGDETDRDLPDAADGLESHAPLAAPALKFTDAAGRKLHLADFRGAGLVVNIWATWCGPCVAEFPTLAAVAPALARAKILVLPISIDFEGLKVVKTFYDQHGISGLPILLDPEGDATDALNTDGIPITVIFNPAGQMVGQAQGAANWNTPRTIALLHHLAGPAPAQSGFQPV